MMAIISLFIMQELDSEQGCTRLKAVDMQINIFNERARIGKMFHDKTNRKSIIFIFHGMSLKGATILLISTVYGGFICRISEQGRTRPVE